MRVPWAMDGGFGGCGKTEKVLAVDWDMSAVAGSNQTPRGAYASRLVGGDGVRECASGAEERTVLPKMGAGMLVGSGGEGGEWTGSMCRC